MRQFFLTLLLLLLVGQSGILRAEDKLPQDAQKKAFNAAMAKAQKGQVDAAIADWEALIEQSDDKVLRNCHFNLAAAHEMQGNLPAAWHHLDTYLRLSPREDKSARKESERLTGLLSKKGFIKVTFECVPNGASVRFMAAKEQLLTCPIAWWFARGIYHVEATLAGYKLATKDIEVAGPPMTVNLKLQALPQKGTLVVQGDGKAVQVFLNGALEGSVPFHRAIPVGTYELMVGKPGEMPWSKQITIEPGITVTERPAVAQKKVVPPTVVEPVKPKGPAPHKPVGEPNQLAARAQRDLHLLEWSLMGAGLAMAAGGAVFHGLAASRNDALKNDYPADPNDPGQYVTNREAYNQRYDSDVQPKLWASYGLYAAGALAVGTGATILLINLSDRSNAKEKAFSLAPVLIPEGGAVTFGLSW